MTTAAIFELNANIRSEQGKSANRRLRRQQDLIPAIVYGGSELPTAISIDHKKLNLALEHEAFYSHLLKLNINGKTEQVILKDLQRHPYKKVILHADFQRVKSDEKITMRVPLHFIGEESAPGVKKGGIINHLLVDIEIRCKASELPEYIEVDLSKLELDQSIHLSELNLPNGIEIPAIHQDMSIVNIHMPRQGKEEETIATTAETKTDEKEKKDKS